MPERSPHRFNDMAYCCAWERKAKARKEHRKAYFSDMEHRIGKLGIPAPHVLEFGCGPGFLAAHLLRELSDIRYTGLDFSRPMLRLAGERLAPYGDRIDLHCTDLNTNEWTLIVHERIHAIVSNQALHDLEDDDSVARVYAAAARRLQPGGILINADLVRTKAPDREYRSSWLTVAQHLELLRASGLTQVRCLRQRGAHAFIVATVA